MDPNDAAHVYYTQSFLPTDFGGPARPTPAPDALTQASRPERSILANLDLLTFNLRLTGHTTTAGVASTGLALDVKARPHGKTDIMHLDGSVQLADDFAFFPVALQAHISGNGHGTPASISYHVDSFDRQLPPPELFVVPSGYREAAALIGVFSGIPRRPPAQAPSEAASAMPNGSP